MFTFFLLLLSERIYNFSIDLIEIVDEVVDRDLDDKELESVVDESDDEDDYTS